MNLQLSHLQIKQYDDIGKRQRRKIERERKNKSEHIMRDTESRKKTSSPEIDRVSRIWREILHFSSWDKTTYLFPFSQLLNTESKIGQPRIGSTHLMCYCHVPSISLFTNGFTDFTVRLCEFKILNDWYFKRITFFFIVVTGFWRRVSSGHRAFL